MTIRKNLNKNKQSSILLAYLVLYGALFLYVAIKQHLNLQTNLFDLGLQEQVIYNTSQGNLFASTVETSNYLGDHFSPIMLFIALIYKIIPSTLTLLTLQVLFLATGLIGVYFLSKKIIGNEWVALSVTVLSSWYWGITGAVLFDFHIVFLAFPLLIWGIYFFENSKYKLSLLFFLLATLCKEDIGIFVTFLGTYYIFYKKNKFGWSLFFIGLLTSFIGLFIVIPYFRGVPSDTLKRYGYLGESVPQMINTFIMNPKYVFAEVATRRRLIYLIKLFAPAFPFVFLTPLFLVVLPGVAINFFSNFIYQTSALYQYDVSNTVGIIYSTIYGLNYTLKYIKVKNIRTLYKYLALVCLAFVHIVSIYKHPIWPDVLFIPDRHDEYTYIKNNKSEINRNKTIFLSNNLGGQFGQFEDMYLFDPPWLPLPDKTPDYIIIDTSQCCQSYDNLNRLTSERQYDLDTYKNISIYTLSTSN